MKVELTKYQILEIIHALTELEPRSKLQECTLEQLYEILRS